jgi:hypothetical protein
MTGMKNTLTILLTFLVLSPATAETVRGAPAGRLVIDAGEKRTLTTEFFEHQVVIFDLAGNTRFLRGIEIELTAPTTAAQNTITVTFYRNIKETGEDEWEGAPVYTESLTEKIASVYQIPLRAGAEFRRIPYVSLFPEPLEETAFPLLLHISPAKAAPEESAPFHLSVKPIPGDEGAVELTLHHPESLGAKPVSVLIDDEMVENIGAPQFLREGEHHLLVLSEDYRIESRRFLVDRGKTTEIDITLKDTVPLLLFEAPDRALIFIDNERIIATDAPHPVAPGTYDIKIQVSDYAIIKTVQVQKGKTYRIAFTIDMSVSETD